MKKENMKNFEEPGYILQSASGQTQKIDKYYFNANEEYKTAPSISENAAILIKSFFEDTALLINSILEFNCSISL